MEFDAYPQVPSLPQGGARDHPRFLTLRVVGSDDTVESGQFGGEHDLVEEIESAAVCGDGADVAAVPANRKLPQELGHDDASFSAASRALACRSGSGATHEVRSKSVARNPWV
jgi:hypothetical protein